MARVLFPTILETHGGPQANETDRFNAEAQAWVDQGFAFLTLNYRGSTGFGRDYEQAIWGRVGELETDDLAAAHAFLVEHGIARPDAIVLTGGSYGGYLTLLGLGRLPELWAGGVAYVAIADWRLMWEDGESLREYQEAMFEGTPEEKPELHATASPITYVDRVAAPLRMVQGRNDARCPARQAEVYISAAERAGKTIEVEWFDAGHGHGADRDADPLAPRGHALRERRAGVCAAELTACRTRGSRTSLIGHGEARDRAVPIAGRRWRGADQPSARIASSFA